MSVSEGEGRAAALLLDIEGTTTPIAFVTGVLFPYARERLAAFLERHAASPEVGDIVARLREEREAALRGGEPVPDWRDDASGGALTSARAFAEWLMDRDRKSTPLKTLQGLIWRAGYDSGEILGEVFPDVPAALVRWSSSGRRVAIFSSGSVLGQQLLFRHSTAGDLTPFLTSYFDTTLGAKGDPASYASIASSLQLPPGQVLFVSDVRRELDAATTAGMQVRLSVRPGNAVIPAGHGYTTIESLDQLP